MSADTVALAIADVAQLSESAADDVLFGYLDPPPFSARWHGDGPGGGLQVLVLGLRYVRRTPALVVTWRWGVLGEQPDWYDLGWHPSEQIYALDPSWRSRLRHALNRRHLTGD